MKKTKADKIYFVILGVVALALLWSIIWSILDFTSNALKKDTALTETKNELRPLTAEEFEKLKLEKFETDLKNLTENFSKFLDKNSDDNWSISALDINKTGLEIDTNKTKFEGIVK